MNPSIDRRNWLLRWVLAFLVAFADLATLAGSATVWLSLVLQGGLYGLYHSIIVEFSLTGIGLAALALAVGYYYSKALNTLYHFQWWWRPWAWGIYSPGRVGVLGR